MNLLTDIGGADHQMFGHPSLIQPYESSADGTDLLLQVISDTDDHDFMWGDCGYLYFTVPVGSENPCGEVVAVTIS